MQVLTVPDIMYNIPHVLSTIQKIMYSIPQIMYTNQTMLWKHNFCLEFLNYSFSSRMTTQFLNFLAIETFRNKTFEKISVQEMLYTKQQMMYGCTTDHVYYTTFLVYYT